MTRMGGTARRGAVVPVVAVVLVGVLAGCTADEPTVGQPPSPTVTVEPTPTPTPTPAPTAEGPMDRSDAELGITFTNLPEVTGDLRAALDAYTLFEVEYRRSLTSGGVTPELELLAAPEIVETVRNTVENIRTAGNVVGGTTTLDLRDVQGGSGAAIVEACLDERDSTLTSASGEAQTGAERGLQPIRIRADLSQGPTGWMVASQEVGGSC
ncbi:hypothetical protein [Cellulomonas carbonis]|uniref:hypothetical protein n=1 Tax=Cellulomonas carbonis TaxID=1386092 RepID=UPI00166AC82A|nr:hypothetical protein [Cellulomonas carbonis]